LPWETRFLSYSGKTGRKNERLNLYKKVFGCLKRKKGEISCNFTQLMQNREVLITGKPAVFPPASMNEYKTYFVCNFYQWQNERII